MATPSRRFRPPIPFSGLKGVSLAQGMDQGYVVFTPLLVGGLDHPLGGDLNVILRTNHNIQYFRGGELVAETIGAEQVAVLDRQRHVQEVDLHLRSRPEGTADDVFEGMVFSRLWGENSAFDIFIDQGVVSGELFDAAVADQVAPAVADRGDRDLIPIEKEGDQSRSHSLERRVLDAGQVNPMIRFFDSTHEVISTPFSLSFDDLPNEFAGRLDGQPAGNLPRSVASHAVGHDEEPDFGKESERVFVAGSKPAGVRQSSI